MRGSSRRVEDFLTQLALLTNLEAEDEQPAQTDDERLRLSTIHQAKGLEFDVVFVIMLCDGLFPSERSLETDEGEEEERRLFYVAITRARNELYLSYPLIRAGFGGSGDMMQQPSRFLEEIPKELVEEWNLRPFNPYELDRRADAAGGSRRYSRLRLLQALGQELGDILEPGGVGRADVHQGLVGLEAGAGDFGLARARRRARSTGWASAGGVRGPWVILKRWSTPRVSSNSVMRGLGLNNSMPCRAWSPLPPLSLRPKPGQHAQEGAVHQHTLGKVEHEAVAALLAEFVDQRP